MSFQNKVVWITGASSGIGEHLAYVFAAQGARLVLSSRNEAELERVKNKCTGAEQVMILPLDVAQFDRIPEAVQAVVAHFGQVDILVNNAGVSQRAYVKDTKFEVDQRIMAINYFGTIALTKAVLPLMQARRSGMIVVISSVMGKVGFPGRSAYAASKHAIHGYFDTLRAEIDKDNIKVCIICPGYVQTNVTVNALKGDGSPNNIMAEETRNGIPVEVFAKKAVRAIAAEKEEFLIGGKEVIAVYLKHFLPGVWSRIIRKRAKG